MGEERQFYVVPDGWPVTIRCHKCERELEAGDRYYMTDDDSWLFCETCGTAKEKPHGPKARLYEPRERVPLHKKRTLREQCI